MKGTILWLPRKKMGRDKLGDGLIYIYIYIYAPICKIDN